MTHVPADTPTGLSRSNLHTRVARPGWCTVHGCGDVQPVALGLREVGRREPWAGPQCHRGAYRPWGRFLVIWERNMPTASKQPLKKALHSTWSVTQHPKPGHRGALKPHASH